MSKVIDVTLRQRAQRNLRRAEWPSDEARYMTLCLIDLLDRYAVLERELGVAERTIETVERLGPMMASAVSFARSRARR